MRWYILLKDIIPRPAGVKVDIIDLEGDRYGFGFETDNKIYNRRYVGALDDKSNFKDKEVN